MFFIQRQNCNYASAASYIVGMYYEIKYSTGHINVITRNGQE